MIRLINGFLKLTSSAKGTLSLIIISFAGVSNMLGHLDGLSMTAIVGTVSTIFMYTHAKTACANIAQGVTGVDP